MIRLRPIHAALLLLALPSCADLAVEPRRVPTTLALDASEVTLTQGDPVALRATVLDQNGDPIATPGWAAPSWASSNSHVVRVSDGAASARGPGQAVATATLAGLSASAVVRVNPSEIAVMVDSVAYRQNGTDVGIITPGISTTVRVFLTADKVNFFAPSVRIDVLEGGAVVESMLVPAPDVSVPQRASSDRVWEVTVPASLVRAGVSFRVVPDPEVALPHSAASERVYPASGSIPWRFAVTYAIHSVQLVQSIQRPDGSVPLIAGRDALLRVFATSDVDVASKPTIRAAFYRNGALVRSYDMQRAVSSFPRTASELFLASSWNVRVAADVLTPGTTLVVEADPAGEIPRSEASSPRYPSSGVLSLDVRAVPTLRLRLIPVHQTVTGSTGDVGPHNLQDFLSRTWSKFPLAEIDADLRATYTTDARLDTEQGWLRLLSEIRSLRDVDGSDRYYYGVHQNPPGAVWGGLGYVGGRAAIGFDASQRAWETMAHELGHNFSLVHAPCGGPDGVDPAFPYPDGGIGSFGYDLTTGTLKTPSNKDLMTYCGPEWISDYHYTKVLGHRHDRDWSVTGPDASRAMEPALLVWGRMHGGQMVLEPAFELEMRPSLPRGGGPYRIEGIDEAGAVLFTYSFTPSPVDHADAKSFSFAIPSRIAQPERLAELRLTGPEGRTIRRRSGAAERPGPAAASRAGRDVSLSWDGADLPMALVRDADTGEVLSFARGGVARVRTPGRALDVLFSDGVRELPALDHRPLMRLTRFRTWLVSGLIAGLATAAPAGAQLALEFRGGASVGNHAPAAAGLEKIPGPALSALVEYTTGQWGGVYAGFARASFGCEDGFCAGDEVAVTTQGFGAGVRLTLPLRSWLRLGGLFHNTRVDTAEGEERTDPAPGYELGGGFAIPLTARFHLAPGVFYRTQFGDQRTTLLGADLGLRFAF